jgi:hypothetical protein
VNWGIIIAGVLTLCIYTFLYKDNYIYRAVESWLIGLSIGYALVIFWQTTIVDILLVPLFKEGRGSLTIPFLMGIMMFSRLSRKSAWLSRIPIALMIGTGAGLAIPAMLYARTLKQLSASIGPIVKESGAFNLEVLIVAVGLLSTLSYFYFGRVHRGAVGRLASLGTYFLMIFFGATFGYTVMSRMSIFIGRIDFLLVDFLRIIK